MTRTFGATALRASLSVLLLGGGCAKVIGIDESETRVQCVSDADCMNGLGCINGSCACVHDCGDAGGSGASNQTEQSCEETASSPCLCDLADRPVTGVPRCTAACGADGKCVLPPSCNGLLSKCGEHLGTSCCQSLPVPGGDFLRSCGESCQFLCDDDHIYPATISTFSLDTFEVTVGRFRLFMATYERVKPSAGAGKNPNNPDDLGWDSTWDAYLPETRQDLANNLVKECEDPGVPMWTEEPDAQENRPINCVSWYVAQAFCIWDGGRLPTRTEWNYAAAGGDEQRYYPWSKAVEDIGPEYAVYQPYDGPPVTMPDAVGAHPLGAGRWGHNDMGGNVAEWVWDGFEPCYSTPTACDDCGTTLGIDPKILQGGDFSDEPSSVAVDARGGDAGLAIRARYGFRCARDL